MHSTPFDYEKSNINRLLQAMRHQEPDRIPHLEFWVTSQTVFEYVLEKKLDYGIVDAALGGQSITPEDHVEFAGRLGMDAVVCNFNWRPNNVMRMASDGTEHYVDGSIKREADLVNLDPPTPIDTQLRYLERYLKAAQGTGVGVFANFTSFFDSTMLAVGVSNSFLMFYDNRPFLEKLMDILFEHQEQVMQAVCDEFAEELAFVLVNDDIGHNAGLMINPGMFREIFPHRMKRLIAPAKAKNKLVAYHTDGKMDKIFPILDDIGFDIVHPIEPSPTTSSRSRKNGVSVSHWSATSPRFFWPTAPSTRSTSGSNSTAKRWAPAAATYSAPPPASWKASRRRTSWP